MEDMKDVVFLESEVIEDDDMNFLDCEIIDDDDDAPLGTLITHPAVASTPTTKEPAPAVNYTPIEEVASDNSQPEPEPTPTPVVEEPLKEEPKPAPVEEPTLIAEEPAPKVEEVAPPVEESAPAPKKARAPKSATLVVQDTAPTPKIRKSKVDEVGGLDASNALHESNFTIEQKPVQKKSDVVSTKKKQEKTEDLWAVAPVVVKKAPTKKATPQPPVEEVKPAPKKKAPAKAKNEEPAVDTAPAPKKKAPAKANADASATPQSATNVENKSTKAEAKMATAKEPAKKVATKAEPAPEKVLVEGDPANPHGKFVIKHTDKGNYVYKLYSYNHRVVAIGAEQYSALPSCKSGINSVIHNAASAPIEDLTLKTPVEQKCPKWVIYKDKKEEFRLRLLASNGNIVATTNDGYLSKEAAKKGIEAIARAAQGASIVRNDDLW